MVATVAYSTQQSQSSTMLQKCISMLPSSTMAIIMVMTGMIKTLFIQISTQLNMIFEITDMPSPFLQYTANSLCRLFKRDTVMYLAVMNTTSLRITVSEFATIGL